MKIRRTDGQAVVPQSDGAKTIALYMRLSAEDRLKPQTARSESDSIKNQRALIRGFIRKDADLSGCAIEEYIDDGFTGTNFERSGFQALLARARKGLIYCVIVKDA